MPAVMDEPVETPTLATVRYSPTEAAIAELREAATEIDFTNPAGYKVGVIHIATCRNWRSGIEKTRAKANEAALAHQRAVNAEAKRIVAAIEEIELPLKQAKQAIDDEKLRQKREAEEAERARVEAEIAAKRAAEEAAAKAIRDAEEARLKAESAALAVERAKLDAERKAAEAEQRKERERIAAEQAAEAAKRKAEQDARDVEQRRIEAEQRKAQEAIDADRRKLEADKQRLERIEFERQAKERALVEAREQAEREASEQAERERKRLLSEAAATREREAKAAEEAERIEAMRPDVERINLFAQILRDTAERLPTTSTEAGAEFVTEICGELMELAERCEQFSA